MIDLTTNLHNGNGNLPREYTAVALGLFDGVHKGHQDVINKACSFKTEGLSPAIFTFETETVTSKGNGSIESLLSHEMKFDLLSSLGVEYIYSPDFSLIKDMVAKDFVDIILKEKLKAKVVVCGYDFRFGKGAFSGTNELTALCNEVGIKTIVIPAKMFNGTPISSTIIRELIRNGEIKLANELLGYNFSEKLEVVHGRELGRQLNFPTINQYTPRGQVIPKFGVYESRTYIDDTEYLSITNIGIKPTVGSKIPLWETHIIDYSGDLYGQVIKVSLIDFIRPEKKFLDIEELKQNILKDVNKVINNKGR